MPETLKGLSALDLLDLRDLNIFPTICNCGISTVFSTTVKDIDHLVDVLQPSTRRLDLRDQPLRYGRNVDESVDELQLPKKWNHHASLRICPKSASVETPRDPRWELNL